MSAGNTSDTKQMNTPWDSVKEEGLGISTHSTGAVTWSNWTSGRPSDLPGAIRLGFILWRRRHCMLSVITQHLYFPTLRSSLGWLEHSKRRWRWSSELIFEMIVMLLCAFRWTYALWIVALLLSLWTPITPVRTLQTGHLQSRRLKSYLLLLCGGLLLGWKWVQHYLWQGEVFFKMRLFLFVTPIPNRSMPITMKSSPISQFSPLLVQTCCFYSQTSLSASFCHTFLFIFRELLPTCVIYLPF